MLLDPLPHLRALSFDGLDATTFLHSQLTSDVRALHVGACQYTSWCNAQGRMISFGLLARESEQKFLWVVPEAEATALVKRLAVFKFRAKLTIGLEPRYVAQVRENSGSSDCEDCWSLPDGRRLLFVAPGFEQNPVLPQREALQAWHLADVRAKLPWSAGGERFVAQVLGLHKLGALSLSKGCYPGQEVIARIHYKGSVKRSLLHLTTELDEAFACPVSLFGNDGTEIGEVIQVVCDNALRAELLCVLASDTRFPLLAAVNHRNITLSLAC